MRSGTSKRCRDVKENNLDSNSTIRDETVLIGQEIRLFEFLSVLHKNYLVDFLPFLYPATQYWRVLWFHVGRPCTRPCVRPSAVRPSVRFSFFVDDNLSKHQWIFTKRGMCIDIVEIWFWVVNGQISSNFYGVVCPRHVHIFVSGL